MNTAVFVGVFAVLCLIAQGQDLTPCQQKTMECIPQAEQEEFQKVIQEISQSGMANPENAVKKISDIVRRDCSTDEQIKKIVDTVKCAVNVANSDTCPQYKASLSIFNVNDAYWDKFGKAIKFMCDNMEDILNGAVCMSEVKPEDNKMNVCMQDVAKEMAEKAQNLGQKAQDKNAVLELQCSAGYDVMDCISGSNFPSCNGDHIRKMRNSAKNFFPPECEAYGSATAIRSLNILALVLIGLIAKMFM